MGDKNKFDYGGDSAQVHWDGKLCIHYGECGRAQGHLFVNGRTPWCQPDLSGADEIREVVLRCPTGALTATFEDGSTIKPDLENNTATISQNGPIYLKGRLEFDDETSDREALTAGTRYRAALCRCGASGNKPFCDNSHETTGFNDSGAVGKTGPGFESDSEVLQVKSVPDGPVMVTGKLTILASTGRVAWQGEKAFLCRCGASENKPFCDGSHKKIGFEA